MICIFGLFHGLILLPVVLCLLGPIENEDEKVRKIMRMMRVMKMMIKIVLCLLGPIENEDEKVTKIGEKVGMTISCFVNSRSPEIGVNRN